MYLGETPITVLLKTIFHDVHEDGSNIVFSHADMRLRRVPAGVSKLEGWWLVVAVGWCWPKPGGFVGWSASLCSVLPALGGDVTGAVLGTATTPLGHHHAAITAQQVGACRLVRSQHACGRTKTRKQQRTAGSGDVGLSRW